MDGIDDLPVNLDRLVALYLHQRGVEITPEQARETGRSAFSEIRSEMKKKGYDLPESDTELLLLLKKAFEDNAPATG